jgi:hypothetical protein
MGSAFRTISSVRRTAIAVTDIATAAIGVPIVGLRVISVKKTPTAAITVIAFSTPAIRVQLRLPFRAGSNTTLVYKRVIVAAVRI